MIMLLFFWPRIFFIRIIQCDWKGPFSNHECDQFRSAIKQCSMGDSHILPTNTLMLEKLSVVIN